jgi:hypothetical protein
MQYKFKINNEKLYWLEINLNLFYSEIVEIYSYDLKIINNDKISMTYVHKGYSKKYNEIVFLEGFDVINWSNSLKEYLKHYIFKNLDEAILAKKCFNETYLVNFNQRKCMTNFLVKMNNDSLKNVGMNELPIFTPKCDEWRF